MARISSELRWSARRAITGLAAASFFAGGWGPGFAAGPLPGLHPGYDLATIRPEGFEPQVGAMALLPDDRLAVAILTPDYGGNLREAGDYEPDHRIYAVSGIDGEEPGEVMEIAAGFDEPAGMCVVDGVLYVSQRDEITRLVDADGDGYFEKHERLAGGWVSDNYHHFTFGLVERDGFLYAALSTAVNLGQPEYEGLPTRGTNGPNPPHRGTVMKVEIATGKVEHIAGGLRTPDGMCLGPEDELFVTEQQGGWNPSNRLFHIEEGNFYGHYNFVPPPGVGRYRGYPSLFAEKAVTPPAVHFPQGQVSISPTQPLLIETGPYAGQLLVGELTAGGIRRVSLERVKGRWQGAIYRFTQGLECGVHRLVAGRDGDIFVGGIGAAEVWSWQDTTFGLQRLRPNGKAVFDLYSVRAVPGGVAVRFTAAPDEVTDAERYEIQQWRYRAGPEYGGWEYERERLAIDRIEPDQDGMGATLYLEGLQAGRVVYLRCDLKHGEESLWSDEAWYTMNQLPGAAIADGEEEPREAREARGGDPAAAAEAGFVTILKPGLEGLWIVGSDYPGWTYEEGIMRHDAFARPAPADYWMRTVERYEDFVLRCRFRMSAGANAGIFLRATTDDSRSGYEIDLRPAPELVGQWNELEISLEGRRLKLTINGQSVEQGLGEDARAGFIGFQPSVGERGSWVEYERIRVRDLKGQAEETDETPALPEK